MEHGNHCRQLIVSDWIHEQTCEKINFVYGVYEFLLKHNISLPTPGTLS